MVHFGGLPESINKTHLVNLKANEQYSTRGVNLKYVYVGNIYNYTFIYDNHDRYSHFDSVRHQIKAPDEFFQCIKKVSFSKFIKESLCFYIKSNGLKRLECDCSIIDSLESGINFGFEETEISLPLNKMLNLKQKPNICIFQIISHHQKN